MGNKNFWTSGIGLVIGAVLVGGTAYFVSQYKSRKEAASNYANRYY